MGRRRNAGSGDGFQRGAVLLRQFKLVRPEPNVALFVGRPIFVGARPEQITRRLAKVVHFKRIAPSPIVQQFDALGLEVEDDGQAVGDLQFRHLVFRDVAQVHQQSSDGVLAAGNEHALPLCQGFWDDPLREERDRPVHAILKRLGLWKLPVQDGPALFDAPDDAFPDREANVVQILDVPWIVAGVMLRERRHFRGAGAVTPPPRLELAFPVPLLDHLLGQSRQVSVVTLVEPPSLGGEGGRGILAG